MQGWVFVALLCFNTCEPSLQAMTQALSKTMAIGKITRSVCSADKDVDPCDWSQLLARKTWAMGRCGSFLSLMTSRSYRTHGEMLWPGNIHCFPALSLSIIWIRCFLPRPLLWTQAEPWSLARSFFSACACDGLYGEKAYRAGKISSQTDGAILTEQKGLVPFVVSPAIRSNCKASSCRVVKIRGMEWALKLKKYICTLNSMANGSPCLLSSQG